MQVAVARLGQPEFARRVARARPVQSEERHTRRIFPSTARAMQRVLVTMPRRCYSPAMTLTVEIEREDDGRWLAEIPALSGVMAYGQDRAEAVARVQALALRVIAEQLEHREAPAE